MLKAVLPFVLLVSACGVRLVDATDDEFDNSTQLESELTSWGSLVGVWKGESGPFTWVTFQRTVDSVGHHYLAQVGATAEAGRFTVSGAALTFRSAGVTRSYRLQRPSAGEGVLVNAVGAKVGTLVRMPSRVSECQGLVCPAVVACTERFDGSHCEAPVVVHSRSQALNADGVLVLNGTKVFPIGFTMPPPPDALAPNGKNAIAELRSAGATFLRTGPIGTGWTEASFTREQQWQDQAFANGMHTWLYLKEAASVAGVGSAQEQLLRRIVNTFSGHPGLGVYKGEDEPAWGKRPVAPMMNAYDLVRLLDPKHPLTLIQAPRNTLAELSAYNEAADIVGTDIYPVSDPMGVNSHLPNHELSVVGDYTDRMRQVATDQLSVWMTLQIAWSGILPPHARVMPTLRQERYMTYQAIIHGARGLFFFGGHMPVGWEGTDAQFGWSWTFWNNALKPVVSEIGEFSPLYPALVAPNSSRPVRIFGDFHGIEYVLREVGGELFVIAARRNQGSVTVTFKGLPAGVSQGEVLYEGGRTVAIKDGSFTDSFGEWDVHVYRFR